MATVVWQEPREGFELNVSETVVTREYQDEKLATQGLDANRFGELVDPSFYIGLGIKVGQDSGISAEGNVNMLSSIVMHRPVKLGEVLLSHGVIRSVQQVPRGQRIETDVWFEDTGGKRVISVPRVSLKPDPAAEKRGAGDRPPPVVADSAELTVISTHQLTPAGTRGYSSEGNAIHYEPDAAQQAGFRAPIIGGGQGVHFLMSALFRDQTPQLLDLDIFFRRPVFWDDTVTVGQLSDLSALALVREHKVLTEMRVNRIQSNGFA